MSVVVTGGTGFLGRRLVRLLREDGLNVRCLVRPTSNLTALRRRWVWVPRPLIQPLARLYEWYHHYSGGQLPGVMTRYKAASTWNSLRYTNQKAKDRLRWRPDVPFDEAFRRSIATEV